MSHFSNNPHPCALSIAGSDSGGGAGIQADLRTFAAHGVHGLTILAAVTAQNTRAVTTFHALSNQMLRAQWQALVDDFPIGAVKTGMLGNRRLVVATARLLADRPRPMPLVVDPVMVATSGAVLLEADALAAMREQLIPLADLLTPNVPEAELLLGRRIGAHEIEGAAHDLLRLGARAVLLKGGHLPGGAVRDVLCTGGSALVVQHERLDVDGHGTGCTLSAAITARLARGEALADAVRGAIAYVHRALRGAYRPGRGSAAVLAHFTAGG